MKLYAKITQLYFDNVCRLPSRSTRLLLSFGGMIATSIFAAVARSSVTAEESIGPIVGRGKGWSEHKQGSKFFFLSNINRGSKWCSLCSFKPFQKESLFAQATRTATFPSHDTFTPHHRLPPTFSWPLPHIS